MPTCLDVTYCCQALTTTGIWDHQLCLSILSTFLLADGKEMYHHSLITMKATLEDKLKKVRFMEHAAGTTRPSDKELTYTNICDLAKTQYQEAKGVSKWSLAAHAKDSKAPPSTFTQAEVMPFFNIFKRVKPLPSCMVRATTLAIYVERKDIGPTNVQTRLALQQCLTQTLPSPMDTLRIFKMSWTWKSMWEPWTLPRKMRRTASKQANLEKHLSNGHRVNKDCKWMHLALVSQMHTAPVVYYPLDSDSH